LLLYHPNQKKLHGLLVDLELGAPNPSRYGELRRALTRELPLEPEMGKLEIELEYTHFEQLVGAADRAREFDFLILSPQSTPWYMYTGPSGESLREAMSLVRRMILVENKPVIGICGGHQFMALAFGGTVDLIDTAFIGKSTGRYPKEAVAERGLVTLETLKTDPIFDGVAIHPGAFRVMESHYDEVKAVPEPFVNLARSNLSEIQLIRMPGKIVYGMAFHPERTPERKGEDHVNTTDGRLLLLNFVKMVTMRDKRMGTHTGTLREH
jgi:GMP synthase (glutamine-hydrolysing)